ncbi:Unknown protein [Striga hermonthica]|uniref:Tify domain-containing protein n=1 Tax=Striga hermonthica TaxID=68872 RepID=A0A9N7NY80_STRHE|nr:Unknown protein [Striga hermonthica]
MSSDKSTRADYKRSQPFFLSNSEQELFCNKKQAVEYTATSSFMNGSSSSQSGNQRDINCVPYDPNFFPNLVASEKNNSHDAPGSESRLRNDYLISLSMSQAAEDPQFLNTALRKVKVNEVPQKNNSIMGSNFLTSGNNSMHAELASKTNGNFLFNNHYYNSAGPLYSKDQNNFFAVNPFYGKPNEMFVPAGFGQDDDVIPYTDETAVIDENSDKGKQSKEVKVKNGLFSNFPLDVRSLLETGIYDGVPVKYVSWTRETSLRGVIKGAGYLCSCGECKLSKVVSGYAFERHAGGRTKHPNKHIYFENGKTISAVAQELKATPPEKLFEAVKTATGSAVHLTNFLTWRASIEAATISRGS